MTTSNKNLKSPKELFEERRLKALSEMDYNSRKKIEEILTKKILPPKYFFKENAIEELVLEKIEDVIEEVEIKEEDSEEVQNQFYEEQISLLKERLFDIEKTISKKVDLTKILEFVDDLKTKIDNLPKQKDYSDDIELIRSDLVRVENNIPSYEVFDPSDLYNNISILKTKIEEVRSEIPEVPQPILYDDQLKGLEELVENVRSSIPVIPEIRYYEDDLNSIIESINQVRKEISQLPEVKYYDEQITSIDTRLSEIQNSIPTVKYYDEDVENLKNEIDDVRNSIPTVKYYDEDVENLKNEIDGVKNSIPTVKYYDEDVENLKNEIEDVKNSIPNVPEVKYYDEDVENLKNEIEDVKNSIPNVPEVKYYDEDISFLNEKVNDLHSQISSIKVPDESVYFSKVKNLYSSFEEKNHKLLEKINYLEEIFEKFNEEVILQENLSEPPEIKNSDPLTPLDQKYVTLDQLQEHYRLFINRIQQQLATIGGGGETRLEFLDDVDRDSVKKDGYVLKYDSSVGKFIGTSYIAQSGGIGTDGSINTTGIITATAFYGNGTNLTGLIGVGYGVEVKDSNALVGTASTLDFGQNLNATLSSGVATINVSMPLIALSDVDSSNLTGISTDYLMVYDPSIPGFKFVDPKSYFGINSDANPSPDIDDYGSY